MPPGDVLDTTGRRGRWPWPVGGVLFVALLVWLQVRSPAPPDTPPATVAGPITAAASGWVAGSGLGPVDFGGPPGVEQLTFVDDRTGFLVQHLCPPATGGPCERRLLASEDGGRSWRPRAELPPAARLLDRFVAVSGSAVAFLDGHLPATIVRSADGGRSWQVSALTRGTPRAAPTGVPIVTDASVPCPGTVCPPWLAWLDVATQQLHRLPGQPDTQALARLAAAPPGPDGELLATAVTGDAGRAWCSRDGGRTWVPAALPLPPGAGVATWVRGFAAGGGRAYAYVTASTAQGSSAIAGFRTDDAGRSWVSLGWLDRTLGMPAGVLAGELIGTDAAGLIYRSSQGGRTWTPSGVQVGSGSVSQQVSGGPVLATVVDASGLETYYRSADGSAWSRVTPPAG